VGKADLSKGYRDPKRKLGVNHAFFIELKFGKKNAWLPTFIFIPVNLAKICFFPIVVTCGKIPLY